MIFYFSATGNSRWAALRLAAATKEQTIDIAREMAESQSRYNSQGTYALQQGERLGFVFPVHGWRVPRLVRTFIERVRIVVEGKLLQVAEDEKQREIAPESNLRTICSSYAARPFVYALCTAGDDIGLTYRWFDRCMMANVSLNSLGIRAADSVYSLIMPESYVGLPFMDVDPKNREREKREKAARELSVVCQEVVARKAGIRRTHPGVMPWLKSKVIGAFFEHVLITDRHFWVDGQRCVRCGICKNVCPVANIEGGKGHLPEWQHKADCLTCFTCYHHCPRHAIEFGRQTRKKGQYYYR